LPLINPQPAHRESVDKLTIMAGNQKRRVSSRPSWIFFSSFPDADRLGMTTSTEDQLTRVSTVPEIALFFDTGERQA